MEKQIGVDPVEASGRLSVISCCFPSTCKKPNDSPFSQHYDAGWPPCGPQTCLCGTGRWEVCSLGVSLKTSLASRGHCPTIRVSMKKVRGRSKGKLGSGECPGSSIQSKSVSLVALDAAPFSHFYLPFQCSPALMPPPAPLLDSKLSTKELFIEVSFQKSPLGKRDNVSKMAVLLLMLSICVLF